LTNDIGVFTIDAKDIVKGGYMTSRPVAEGKDCVKMRISNAVIDEIEIQEIDSGLYDSTSAFIQHFLFRYFAGETLKREPIKGTVRDGKVARMWHFRSDLMEKVRDHVRAEGFRSEAAFINHILARYYYSGDTIKIKKEATN
jgi:hypothetical protein